MARAQGARAQMALAYETVYGTPPVSGFRLMPFARATLGSEQPLLESELLGYGRDPLAPIKDAVTVDGEVMIPIDVEAFGYWLKAAFGQPTTAGTTPKTHTFQSGNWTLPSMAVEVAMPEVPRFAMYSGCVLDQLSWQMQRSGLLTATARLVAQGETIAATTAAGTPTALGLQRFGHFNGTVKRNATVLGNLVSAEITYSNNLDRIETIRGDGRIDGADPTKAALSGRIEVRFADSTLVTQAIDGSPCELEFTYSLGANASFTFTAHAVSSSRDWSPAQAASRALSLERGSLLDIILRLKEVRPQMWEDTISTLAEYSVAADPKLGISGVLESINASLKKYVPKEWGIQPHLKVSSLTREHLRKIITAFIATGEGSHAAPFYRQGTGTINMLVLAMLSQIAADKQNVIFAMEEPETAIPPYAQKRIVHEIRQLAAQAIFTSHSPYVLEEFTLDETIVLGRDVDGVMRQSSVVLPKSIKLKSYRQNFRTRFSEGLLARRILVAEGATEASAFPVVCRRLAELNPGTYASLEALGVCVIDAGGESNVSDMAKLYRELGKRTFAICDKQSAAAEVAIAAEVDILLMHPEKGFEDLVLQNTTEDALKRFAKLIDWPQHLSTKYPDIQANAAAALSDYFEGKKADWGIADFLAQCSEAEIPEWLRKACIRLRDACDPTPTAPTGSGDEPGDVTDAAD